MSKEIDKKRCGANVEKVFIDEFVPSKELDELERGIIEFEKYLEDDCNNEWLKRVVAGMKKCYQRLESIDNANSDEALELVKRTCELYVDSLKQRDLIGYDIIEKQINESLDTINQALIKAQEQDFNYKNIVIPFFDELVKLLGINDTDEMLNKIKEQEKVLEIIKVKPIESGIAIEQIKKQRELTYSQYKKAIVELSEAYLLTQEEFDTLKRYFK